MSILCTKLCCLKILCFDAVIPWSICKCMSWVQHPLVSGVSIFFGVKLSPRFTLQELSTKSNRKHSVRTFPLVKSSL